jgi:hypothetical protein
MGLSAGTVIDADEVLSRPQDGPGAYWYEYLPLFRRRPARLLAAIVAWSSDAVTEFVTLSGRYWGRTPTSRETDTAA